MKRHIPNAITCANLFSGCIAIVFAFKGELQTAAWFAVLSGVFDFFDGFAARALNVKSNIGKDLDSLADVISFGFLPGVIMFKLLEMSEFSSPYLPYLGFIITVFSALRLAKFNNDTRQTEDFIGLNTPMNTFFIASLPFIGEDHPAITGSVLLLTGVTALVSYMLISEWKLFSMKFNSYQWKPNRYKYLFLIVSVVLAAVLQFAAVPFILLLYVGTSFLHFKKAQLLS
ncbi:MAG: CDP-diacylglycerol--serine O-phosphatidyltransferase [Sphingobacteriales bacterium]|nr:MAG: CDP-diacylglycerol--serine O-phosphatidyltransferase [Sphingobacteriales bacterium]